MCCRSYSSLRQSSEKIVVLTVYIDDIVITRDDMSGIHQVKDYLSRSFEIKTWVHYTAS